MYWLEDYGFELDECLVKFVDIFDDKNVREVHIDTYLDEPYVLLSRVVEKNVLSSLKDDRFVLRQRNGNRIILTDIPLDSIDNCMIKRYSDTHYQIVCEIMNVYYKILVIV